MIVTITMNPAVDKSTAIDKLIPEKKMRCSPLITEAGGGGINVSKAIRELGGDSLAVFPKGGITGQMLENYLLSAAIPFRTIQTVYETRENFMVSETSTGAQYRFIMPGAALSREEADDCFDLLRSLTPVPTMIVASGSLPPGLPETFFAQLARVAKQLGAKYILDSSGKPLLLAAREGVYLLKPNLTELCSLAGKNYLELNEVEEAARELIHKGFCEVMVVSMGPAGALLLTRDICEKIPAPIVKKLSTVGAGDSMVGGMVWMLGQNCSLREMARFGVACGTAATMNPGTRLFKKEDTYRVYDWINRQASHNDQ